MLLLRERLEHYLATKSIDSSIEPITPDASTRRYFRFENNGRSCVACVYPDDIKHAAHNYVDVSSLFLTKGLPVAELYDFDEVNGIVVVEDLGDRIVREELESATPERKNELVREAIGLIAKIQSATNAAEETNSIAGRLRFDAEKLLWELNYFKIHYFSTFKKEPLESALDDAINAEFQELASELESYASVLCHRDFHAANLMIDESGALRIIDHQDARIGSPAYDLVSLLLDRVVETPSADWLKEMTDCFFDSRAAYALAEMDRTEFDREFDLQTVQRCLKAAGTFSFQSAVREKAYFVPFINPMFRITIEAIDRLDRFPNLRNLLSQQLGR
ncbi:MAG: aminoglycoside phosphotransferase family protein [Pyrinomonadaceae bacterium]